MESMITNQHTVRCDGTNSDKKTTNQNILSITSGHPAVYLNVPPKDVVYCPYCSRSFVFKQEKL